MQYILISLYKIDVHALQILLNIYEIYAYKVETK